MKYIISNVTERETTAGKKYLSVTLTAGEEQFEKVSLWSDDPDYATFQDGATIKGTLTKNEKGYWNFKKEGDKPAYKGGAAISKAMETKATNIEIAQDRKHDAIKMAGAQRDAVLMVTTFEADAPFPTEAELKAKIEGWMRYFLGLKDQPFI